MTVSLLGLVQEVVPRRRWSPNKDFLTLLLERDKMPRPHVGESLMPEAYWIFERLGIVHELDRIGFTRKNGVQFVNSDDKESKPFIFSRA